MLDCAACLLLRIPQAAAGAPVWADDRCERTAQAVVERAVLDSTLVPFTQVRRGGLSVSPHLIHFTPTTAPQQLLHRALPCRSVRSVIPAIGVIYTTLIDC